VGEERAELLAGDAAAEREAREPAVVHELLEDLDREPEQARAGADGVDDDGPLDEGHRKAGDPREHRLGVALELVERLRDDLALGWVEADVVHDGRQRAQDIPRQELGRVVQERLAVLAAPGRHPRAGREVDHREDADAPDALVLEPPVPGGDVLLARPAGPAQDPEHAAEVVRAEAPLERAPADAVVGEDPEEVLRRGQEPLLLDRLAVDHERLALLAERQALDARQEIEERGADGGDALLHQPAPRRVDAHVLHRHGDAAQHPVGERPARGIEPRAALRGVDREAQLARDLGGGEELPRERLRPLAVELRLRGVVRALEVVGERPQHLRRALPGEALGHLAHRAVGAPPVAGVEAVVDDLLEALREEVDLVLVAHHAHLLEDALLLAAVHEVLRLARVLAEHAGEQLEIHVGADDGGLGDHLVQLLVERVQPAADDLLERRGQCGLHGLEVPRPVDRPERPLVDQRLQRLLDEERDAAARLREALHELRGRRVPLQDLRHHAADLRGRQHGEAHALEARCLAQEGGEAGERQRRVLLPLERLGLHGRVDEHAAVGALEQAAEHLEARLVHVLEVVEEEHQRAVAGEEAEEIRHAVEEQAAALLRGARLPPAAGRGQRRQQGGQFRQRGRVEPALREPEPLRLALEARGQDGPERAVRQRVLRRQAPHEEPAAARAPRAAHQLEQEAALAEATAGLHEEQAVARRFAERPLELGQLRLAPHEPRAREPPEDLHLGGQPRRAGAVHAVLPFALGAVERLVGRLDQLRGRGGVAGIRRDAEAHRRGEAVGRLVGDEALVVHALADLLGHAHAAGGVHTLEEHEELVAREPDGVATLGDRVADQLGQELQDAVAVQVAARVVDLLEAVHVEHDHGERRALPGEQRQAVAQVLAHEPPVVEPGQLVDEDQA